MQLSGTFPKRSLWDTAGSGYGLGSDTGPEPRRGNQTRVNSQLDQGCLWRCGQIGPNGCRTRMETMLHQSRIAPPEQGALMHSVPVYSDSGGERVKRKPKTAAK
ncbi:uncharacterized protein LOC125501503 [Athalia rosae]|uniref:uncharacterized protein LOC125501503 n=1 Tax=Athalia rosae TaxID=37344 RepID=UPI0020341F4A|nr:uncharacterized protein LOC125501503 [Athalia rosae]